MRFLRRLRSRTTALPCLVAVLLFAACVFSLSVDAQTLSTKARFRLFDQVWKLIEDKYYDPTFHGVNWKSVGQSYRRQIATARTDAETYDLLKHMTGELHDAHTRYRSPAERDRAKARQATTPGISITEVEGQPVVSNVEADSDAQRAGVEPGMIVTSIDGGLFPDRLKTIQLEVGASSSPRASALLSYYELLAGEPGTAVRLTFLRADGSTLNVSLPRHLVSTAPPVTARTVPSGYGYIKLNLFGDPAVKEFSAELARLRKASALIIDLRGNPGGDLAAILHIAGHFFSNKVSFGRVITRSGKAPSLLLRILGVPSQLSVGDSGGPIYEGPMVVLVNEASGSAAEIFAAGMQEHRRALIVGRETCGCVLGSVAHTVKGGGELDISEFAIVTGKDRTLEGSGVLPDIAVPLRLQDLRQHRDATLTAAVAALQSSPNLRTETSRHR